MLEVSQLRASYRGIEALRGINLRVAEGEMIAIIGANGAGKSTLLNCLSGVVRASGGHILFDGSDITQRPPHLVSRAGLLQVPEGRQVLAEMSVHENLLLGLLARGPRAARYDLERVLVLFPILRERLQQLAGTLSGGQQQMLAIGRALMGSPRVLLLDEPQPGSVAADHPTGFRGVGDTASGGAYDRAGGTKRPARAGRHPTHLRPRSR